MLTSPLPFTLLLLRWLLVLVLLRRPLVSRGEACWDILAETGTPEDGDEKGRLRGDTAHESACGKAGRMVRVEGKVDDEGGQDGDGQGREQLRRGQRRGALAGFGLGTEARQRRQQL